LGHTQAQFNVAAMLDSGRGAPRDVAQASIWYARAAAGGNRRAAFNLGQLYESGEGVPANIDSSAPEHNERNTTKGTQRKLEKIVNIGHIGYRQRRCPPDISRIPL
jgi:TPR repeat protein